jgi:hypothetical protein
MHYSDYRLRLFKGIRAVALVFLQERARLGYALAVNKFQKPWTAQDWNPFGTFNQEQMYERIEAGLGGLRHVPLLNGETEEYRPESDDQTVRPPVGMLRGLDTTPDPDFVTLGDVQAARFAALLDIIVLMQHDPTIDARDPGPWADALFGWLGQPAGISRSGRMWTTDPAVFGKAYRIDVWAARTGTGTVVSVG